MEKYRFSPMEFALLEQMPAPLAVYQFIDKRVVTLALSEGFCKLFGYQDKAEAYHYMDHDMYRDTHPDDAARIADAAFRFATEDEKYEVIYRTKKYEDSGYHIIHAFGRHIYTSSGVRLAYVWYTDEGTYTEDTDTQKSELNRALNNALHEESILKASYYDHLTGLPSMTYFFELAETGKSTIKRDGGEPALLFLDLSGMKYYNTTHSFAEGDKVLRAFAKKLAQTFSNENCCHVAADHFAVYTKEEGLEDTLRQLFFEWQEMNGKDALPIRAGIYLDRMEEVPVSTACDRAKVACDLLRNTYVSGFQYYSLNQQTKLVKRQYILTNFDQAMEEKWIQVYYQPIIRAVNGRVCDEEALARWIDPEKGFLSPDDFIPYLEDAGLIYKLDLYVLDRTLEKMKLQETMGFHVVSHSINLSRSDFDSCDIVEEIRKRVDAAGVARDKISIEITETVIGRDFEFMKGQIERFQKLGFPVWMDDFGSGYSSLDVLQSIRFDLIKFDMSFMKKLDASDSGRIILTELVKMATALGVDTICEGVETEGQVRFLQDIGCSKLQGYYFTKPIPLESILERYEKGIQIGYENTEESAYLDVIGRVNLYDLSAVVSKDGGEFQNYFHAFPIGIMELRDDEISFLRSNQSYRDFMKRYFGHDLETKKEGYFAPAQGPGSAFISQVKQCCDSGLFVFFDEKMPDGTTVHSFVRRIGSNPVTGAVAVACAVISITDGSEGATYAGIARALAADYYNIYYVDLKTDDFIEYSSPVGGEELAMERRGKNFFEASAKDTMKRIYDEDRETFLSIFTKDNIIRELDRQGVFTATYRLIDSGRPIYVSMKVTRMLPDGQHIIIGISIIDAQMKQKEAEERLRRESVVYGRIKALAGDYLSLYTVDPENNSYIEYSSTKDYESLGLAKEGDDFFRQAVIDGRRAICPEDLSEYLRLFTKENILRSVRRDGVYVIQYRLMIRGEPVPVTLKAALVQESDGEKLILGVARADR